MGTILKVVIPIVYLLSWVLLLGFSKLLGLTIDIYFMLFSLLILFFGLISKSTAWSIGHDKFGIKGDSTSKKVEFCADGICTIKIFDDDPETRQKLMIEAGAVIRNLRDHNTGTNSHSTTEGN